MTDFNTQLQIEDMISAEDFLAWVHWCEGYQQGRDDLDEKWDKIFQEIDRELLDKEELPW